MFGLEKRKESIESQSPQEVLNQINDEISKLDQENDAASTQLKDAIWKLEDQLDDLSQEDKDKYEPEIEALKIELKELELTGNVITDDFEKIQKIRDLIEKGTFEAQDLFENNPELFVFVHKNFDNNNILTPEIKQKILQSIKTYAQTNGYNINDDFIVGTRTTDKKEFYISRQFANGIGSEEELTFKFGKNTSIA